MSSEQTPVALIGVAVDVSGSMQGSIRNRNGTSQSRFESFREALVRVVRASRQRAEELARSGGPGGAEALVFAYAFGLSTSPEVVDLLALLAAAEGVTTPGEIERLKQRYSDEIRQRYAGYAGLGSSGTILRLRRPCRSICRQRSGLCRGGSAREDQGGDNGSCPKEAGH